MGRTMAGKSTLFEFLSGGDGERVGDGRQRYSRDSCVRIAKDLGIEIVDTPGVGAMDGLEDFEAAFGQVADADLILWVATDQATQEQTGRALEALSDLGKPILVALNCLADITDEIGLLDMLEDPDRVFGGDAAGNLAPIRRHLARAGGRYIHAVAIHAQAALLSISGPLGEDDSRTLYVNSRIDSLADALRHQAERTADQRRLVSIADGVRPELMDASSAIQDAIVSARMGFAASTGFQNDFRKRGFRRVDDAHEELRATFASAISARERWVDHVDVDQPLDKINRQLDQEMTLLRAELERSVVDIGQGLESDLKMIAVDVAEDWAEFDVGGFRNLTSRAAIWGNRAVKAGGRFAVGLGGLALGAKIGLVAGTALSPGLGNAIGMVVGAVVGLALGLLGINKAIDWIGDKSFRSPTEVHERRRQKVRAQMTQLLDNLRESLESAGQAVRRDWLDAVEIELSKQSASSATFQRSAEALQRVLSAEVEPVIAQIDAELTRELLRSAGRTRAASAVARATRWRGAGIAVELPEPAFSELLLFPIGETVDRIMPTSAHGTPATNALHIIRNLTDQSVTVHQMTSEALDVSLDVTPAPGIREAWEALARVHTGVSVQIIEIGGGQL